MGSCSILVPPSPTASLLLSQGADWLDLGAESSNPEGEAVPADLELDRLLPVLQHFKRQGARISIDTHKPEVMRVVLAEGADMINDISALDSPGSVEVLAAHTVPVVLMFSRSPGARADKVVRPHHDLLDEILAFFRNRLQSLEQRGIARSRVMIDPGMGFFLGSNPEPSLWVLKNLAGLKPLGCPDLCVGFTEVVHWQHNRQAAHRSRGWHARRRAVGPGGRCLVHPDPRRRPAGRRLGDMARDPRRAVTRRRPGEKGAAGAPSR